MKCAFISWTLKIHLMEQMLLLTFTEKKSGKLMRTANAEEDVALMMQEMKGFLDSAASELLQPRAEAVTQLLKRAKR